jgi:hypothetical protein
VYVDTQYIADNILAQGYVGGNNVTWRGQQHNTPVKDSTDASLYACLVPYDCSPDGGRSHNAPWEPELPNPIDITGSASPESLVHISSVTIMSWCSSNTSTPVLIFADYSNTPSLAALKASSRALHYATANFYARVHSWNNNSAGLDETSMGLANTWNTVCFQGHQVRTIMPVSDIPS